MENITLDERVWDLHDYDAETVKEMLRSYQKSKIRKMTLKHLKMGFEFFNAMREAGVKRISSRKFTGMGMALALAYEDGLHQNLSGLDLVNYTKSTTIDFFEKLKLYCATT